MRNWKNWVFVLSVGVNVAVLIYLVTGAGTTTLLVNPAQAQNRSVNIGQYAATTAHVTSSRAPLFLVDNRAKKMLVYSIGPTVKKGANNVKLHSVIDLTDDKQGFGKDLQGDVVLIPGEVTGQYEAVYAIDSVGKRLIAYAGQDKRGTMILGARNLETDFAAVAPED